MSIVPSTSLWKPKSRILGLSGVAVSNTATTAEEVLAIIPIPGGALGLNGIVRITLQWGYTSNANLKTLRVRLGGIGGAIFASNAPSATNSLRQQVQLQNRGSFALQVGAPANQSNGGWSSVGAVPFTATVDTAVAQDLVITGQKASAGDTLTLESYLVELLNA